MTVSGRANDAAPGPPPVPRGLEPPAVRLLRRVPAGSVVPPWADRRWEGLDAYLTRANLLGLQLCSLFLLGAVLVGWPRDFVMLEHDDPKREVFLHWRLGLILLIGLSLPVVWRSKTVARHPVIAAAALGFAWCLWTAWMVGRTDGFQSPWPYFHYFALVLPAPVPAWPRHRLAVVTVMAAAIVLGYVVLHPEHRADPWMGDAMALLLTIMGMAMLAGEAVLASAVLIFFQRAQLEDDARDLSVLNASLDARIDLQTRELRALGRHLVEVQEAERNRLARDLHDDLGQQLAAARLMVSAAQAQWPTDGEQGAAMLRVDHLLGEACETVRTLAGSLRPHLVAQVGLEAACATVVRSMVGKPGIAWSFTARGGLDDLPEDVGIALYRVLQEALTNVTRHAGASTVDVDLVREGGRVRLSVVDDGVGIPSGHEADRSTTGLGLLGMRERAISVGGSVRVERPSAGGTRIVLTAPLPGTGAA